MQKTIINTEQIIDHLKVNSNLDLIKADPRFKVFELENRCFIAFSSDEFSALLDITSIDDIRIFAIVTDIAVFWIESVGDNGKVRYIVLTKKWVATETITSDFVVLKTTTIHVSFMTTDLTKYKYVGDGGNFLFFIKTEGALTNYMIVNVKDESVVATNSMAVGQVASAEVMRCNASIASVLMVVRNEYGDVTLMACDILIENGVAAWGVSIDPIDLFPTASNHECQMDLEKLDDAHCLISCNLPRSQNQKHAVSYFMVKVFITYATDSVLVDDIGLRVVTGTEHVRLNAPFGLPNDPRLSRNNRTYASPGSFF